MIDKSVFTKILRENLNKDIVVVTIDEQAFRGRLLEFDDEAIAITNVMESYRKDMNWTQWHKPIGTLHEKATLAIRIETISRIWEAKTEKS